MRNVFPWKRTKNRRKRDQARRDRLPSKEELRNKEKRMEPITDGEVGEKFPGKTEYFTKADSRCKMYRMREG